MCCTESNHIRQNVKIILVLVVHASQNNSVALQLLHNLIRQSTLLHT